jgi:hypothetical protein
MYFGVREGSEEKVIMKAVIQFTKERRRNVFLVAAVGVK